MKKFLNFGSLNIDTVYRVDHFVSAGETLAPSSVETFPGGKGLNQSVALARAGAQVWHAGRIGPDGTWLADVLDESGVHTEFIDRTGERTGGALIQLTAKGENCILLDGGANRQLQESHIDAVFSSFAPGDCLVLQNEVNFLPRLIRRAADIGMDIALNPSPVTDDLRGMDLSPVTWLLLNEIEGEALTGERAPERIAEALLGRYPKLHIVLTLGRDGVLYRDAHECVRQGIFPVSAVDTTAAGDTFTGFFLHAVTAGSAAEALRTASAAAALAVSRKGAAVSIPAMEEVRRFLETSPSF